MGTIKAKTKEEIIQWRRENSQWGWVWNKKKEQHKRLIISINTDGSCRAIDNDSLENYYEGNFYVVTIWENYELIEEAKPTVYRPWTKQPYKSMFDAIKWEFRHKNTDNKEHSYILVGIWSDYMRIGDSLYTLLEMFNEFEMRQENGPKKMDQKKWTEKN